MKRFFKYGACVVAGGLYIWAVTFLVKDDNWSGVSAMTTMLLAIAAFWAILESQKDRAVKSRDRALEYIIDWAEETINALATPTKAKSSLHGRMLEELAILQPCTVMATRVLWYAKRIGGSVDSEVKKTVFLLQKFNSILMGKEGIQKFKERFNIEEDITPLTEWEDAAPLIKDVMEASSALIETASKELLPGL